MPIDITFHQRKAHTMLKTPSHINDKIEIQNDSKQ